MGTAPRYTRTVFGKDEAIPENSNRVFKCSILDADGNPVAYANVTTFSMRIDDLISGQAVRATTDVKSGLAATSGAFQYVFTGVDVQMIGTGLHDRRLATFHVVHATGEEWHEVEYHVENLRYVP